MQPGADGDNDEDDDAICDFGPEVTLTEARLGHCSLLHNR